ncbi:hypothetical protein [Tabrizicola sp. YIM 78059]|uniref:hypothetical protein n=1 Tax=Tabrizicola sp. YIM 78059 TaxID=2529861 RepID=UPI0010AA62B6|nr:hypothetical protein [Tabrizicola sp. YIM 78059]
MTSRLSLLVASSALTLTLGLPALAASQGRGAATVQCSSVCTAVFSSDDGSTQVIRVSGDDDDEDEGGWGQLWQDDDEGDDCDEEDDEDEDDDCGGAGARGNPAPAGTVAPPANGLFGSGAPPVAVTK